MNKVYEAESEMNCGRYDDVKLYTVKDIMIIFSCGRDMAYRLMHSNTFPTIVINNRLFVSAKALQNWIDMYEGRSLIA